MIDKLNKLCNEALEINSYPENKEDLIKNFDGCCKINNITLELSKLYNKKENNYSNGFGNSYCVSGNNIEEKTFNKFETAIKYFKSCVKKSQKRLQEKWDKMEGSSLFGDAYFTDRFDDVLSKLKSIPAMGYKILADEKKGFYMLCNAEDNIHNDMLKAAVSMGFYYPEMTKDWEVEDYIYCSTYNDENYLIYLTIKPDDKDPGDQMCDGYYCQYIYKDFVLYPRDCDYEETKFYQALKDKLIKVNPLED